MMRRRSSGPGEQPQPLQQPDLMQQGAEALVTGLIKDLKSEEYGQQARALAALEDMASSSSLPSLHSDFRSRRGFEALLMLLEAQQRQLEQIWANPALKADPRIVGQPLQLMEAVLARLQSLLKCDRSNKAAALEAGLLPQLVVLLEKPPQDPHLMLTGLKLLHSCCMPDSSLRRMQDLLDQGLLPLLGRLLAVADTRVAGPEQGEWVGEVLSLMALLVQRGGSRAAQQLTNQLGVVAALADVLMRMRNPRCLSQALDILEGLLATDSAEPICSALARGGCVRLLVATMLLENQGLALQAATVLARLAQDRLVLRILAATLSPSDLQRLVAIATAARAAQDEDGLCSCTRLLSLLAEADDVLLLRGLVLGRSLAPCLEMPQLRAPLLSLVQSTLGEALLLNLAQEYAEEAAIALADVVPSVPSCAELLLLQQQHQTLLAAALKDAQLVRSNSLTGEAGPAGAMGGGRVRGGAALRAVARLVAAVGLQEAGGTEGSSNACGHAGDARSAAQEMRCAGPAGHRPAPQPASAGEESTPGAPAVAAGYASSPAGDRAAAGAVRNSLEQLNVSGQKRYDTVAFRVGGRDFFALGWVLQQGSPVLRELLSQQQPGASGAGGVVAVPVVAGLEDEQAFLLFGKAVEFMYCGETQVEPKQWLLLWGMACGLRSSALQDYCETRLDIACILENGQLEEALEWVYRCAPAGSRRPVHCAPAGSQLPERCAQHLLLHLLAYCESGFLARTLQVPGHREGLVRDLSLLLGRALRAFSEASPEL